MESDTQNDTRPDEDEVVLFGVTYDETSDQFEERIISIIESRKRELGG